MLEEHMARKMDELMKWADQCISGLSLDN
jgi:hypothetical protein